MLRCVHGFRFSRFSSFIIIIYLNLNVAQMACRGVCKARKTKHMLAHSLGCFVHGGGGGDNQCLLHTFIHINRILICSLFHRLRSFFLLSFLFFPVHSSFVLLFMRAFDCMRNVNWNGIPCSAEINRNELSFYKPT